MRHSIAVHPYRLIQAANPLVDKPRSGINRKDYEVFRNTGQASVRFLQSLVENSYCEKLVSLLKDLYVAICIPNSKSSSMWIII